MANVLTSWKEIAQHLGKGVRTVQRWEEHFGLPIRRLQGESHHAVLALPEEIDAWVRERTAICGDGVGESELERLRGKILELQRENAALRSQLEGYHLEPAAPEGIARWSSVQTIDAKRLAS